ncbi:YetF domain-containing protein [Spirosoma rigui]|uniref:YetF domain-containing protein n=1 Tax=Spirosoma rigui TaxID=564064 RepID=UPI0009B141B7|nr:YetF domain-containing protein [Spirosoma rigui]
MPDPVDPFDIQRILIDQFPWTYLGEVAFRTVFMFLVLLTALTISGKREVRQLSIYELVLVIGLGSAAGDPMFYHDVPLSSAVVVFVVMMSCYKLATYISDRNKRISEIIEGKPVYVIEDGRILIDNFDREDLGIDELFSDLRTAGIEQLGQVRVAILEPSGQLSVFQFEPSAVREGLPILPKLYDRRVDQIQTPGQYACRCCGSVMTFNEPTEKPVCPRCQQSSWVLSSKP